MLIKHTHMPNRAYGPRPEDSPPNWPVCPGCKKPFKKGDWTTLVLIGPGDFPENQQACREGKAYNGAGIEAHWACVTGEAEVAKDEVKGG